LAKYGLVQSVLDELGQLLDQFDAAATQVNDGRTAHIGATAELHAVAQAIVRTVRAMDGRNRQRFANDAQLLGSWLSASMVLGQSRAGSDAPVAPPEGGTPAGGEVRPAA
jgi:hypothetical protein